MKKRNEDDPDNLGGLGGMLSAEVLKMLNELLEQLHLLENERMRKSENEKTIEINIYEKGSWHVDNVENQHFYGEKWAELPKAEKSNLSALPDVLATEEAMALWEKVQDAGYVDAHYQPLISRTQAALLADAMAERLGIREKWKTFETLWNRKNMYRDYYQALDQRKTLYFQEKIKKAF